MNKFKKILDDMLMKKYYTSSEIQYNTKDNILLSNFEFQNFLIYKDEQAKKNSKYFEYLPLKSFDNHSLYFGLTLDLLNSIQEYLSLIIGDFKEESSFISLRNMDDIMRSRIYSELEGSLNIESIPTIRKRVDDLICNRIKPQDMNDIIIKNMAEGIDFVNKVPKFNKENLFKLYSILTKGCLSEDYKLKDKEYYRYDEITVGKDYGCPVNLINSCMDSLFDFVNKNIKNRKINLYLPHIAHFYIVYVHPYFDYNGRTARMVSLWLHQLTDKKEFPLTISEAINLKKSEYYEALQESRYSHNDITYFLIYIYNVSITYYLVYKNIEKITTALNNENITWTENEKNYFKKILICYRGKFTYQDFCRFAQIKVSKQGALKILNNFVDYGLLRTFTSTSNKKLYDIDIGKIYYILPNLKRLENK